jgi:8-oxo-dGTP pyrophosphatase MutT (NUDIX family)
MSPIDPAAEPPHLFPPPAPSWVREAGGEADTTIESNWLFRLRRERFRSRGSGRSHDYFVIHLADAVNVIALTPDQQVVLVRQFRAGSGRDSLEPPGGLLEPGEDPCLAGARELLEETGYAGDPAVLLGSAWSNPSLLSSKIAVVVVNNARPVAAPKPDDLEEVTVVLAPARSIPRMIRDGRIDHALSVMGLLWWLNSRWPGSLAPPAPRKPVRIKQLMALAAIVGLVLAALTRLSDPLTYLIVTACALAVLLWFGVKRLSTFRGFPWEHDRG